MNGAGKQCGIRYSNDMNMERFRFLIVDDSEMIRQFILVQLRSLGAKVIEQACDGQEALRVIQQSMLAETPFHIVILDWEMPKMSGFDVLKKCREDPFLKNVAFLMVSTVCDESRIRKIAPYVPNGYLVKPFTPQAFAERVAALCEKIQHTIT